MTIGEIAPYVGIALGLLTIGTVLLRIGGNAATTSLDLKNLNERHSSLAKETREGRSADQAKIAVLESKVSVYEVEFKQLRKEVDELKKEKASAESMAVVSTAVQRIESGIFAVRAHLTDKG